MTREEIEHIDIRNKIVLECPNIIKQAGLSQVDFGSLFLGPTGELAVNSTQNILNDIIDINNNLDNILTPETITSVTDTLVWMSKDIIATLKDYFTSRYKEYISAEYGTTLLMNYTKASGIYYKQYVKTPDEILKEIYLENPEAFNNLQISETEKNITEILNKISDVYNVIIGNIAKYSNEIQKYTDFIAKCMIYGPDYVSSELVALYTKYRDMGLSMIDSYIGELATTINTSIDFAALVSGKYLAEKTNAATKKTLKDAIDAKRKTEVKAKLQAMNTINKATMNLLSILGI